MKKILTIGLIILACASACKKTSLLDNKSNNALNETTVFTDSVNAVSFLTRIYMDMGYAFDKNRWEAGGQEQATDDSEYINLNPDRRPLRLYTSTYSADDTRMLAETWTQPYANIRRVNLFLSKMPVMPFKPQTKTRLAAEARMLRAWYYYNLLITFGGVPLIGDQLFPGNELITIPRSSFEDCVNYVVKELDQAAADLPVDQTGNDYGRVTKGAALAVKTKMLLFAASPLFNGNTWSGAAAERIALAGYPTYDVARWDKVLMAAEEVIALNYYELYTEENPSRPGYGFYRVFLQRRNKEHIFFVMQPPNRDFEDFYLPKSRNNSDGSSNPTQNVVDAFPMLDGRPISAPSALYPYNAQDPYANRDPRFRYSIIYNTATWFSTTTNSEIPVFTYVGAQTDGFYQDPGAAGASGYFSRKMLAEGLTANFGTTDRNWPLIRYAEILLIKAEALNELNRTGEAYAPVREIRKRGGIIAGADNNYGMQAGMTQENMRSFIQNERRIELFNEDKRWDDVRRWKLATALFDNKYNKLMSPTKVPVSAQFPTGYKYDIVNSLRLHTFKEKNYLLPFETGEMLRNTALIQNPAW